jgi:hypothetical protein
VGGHAFVVKLASLCQQLRQTVISEPLLWSTLFLSQSSKAKALLWKSRSRGIFRALHLCGGPTVDSIYPVLEVLHDVPMNHLRVLSVGNIPWEAVTRILPNITPSVISNLHYLELFHSCQGLACFDDTVNLDLRHLEVENTLLDYAKLGEHATHLVHLSILARLSEDLLPDFLWIFHRNRNLESISLYSSILLGDGTLLSHTLPARSLPSRIELSKLSSLSLCGNMLRADHLLPHLYLPNLQHLQLDTLPEKLEDTVQNLINIGAAGNLISLSLSLSLLHPKASTHH